MVYGVWGGGGGVYPPYPFPPSHCPKMNTRLQSGTFFIFADSFLLLHPSQKCGQDICTREEKNIVILNLVFVLRKMLVVLELFCHCNRLSDKNNSVEERLIPVPSFRGYNQWSSGSSVASVSLNIMTKGCGGTELFISQ